MKTDAIQRWSTAGVPQGKRLDYFAAALSEAVYPLGVDRADPLTFQANVSCASLGGVGVCKTVGSPHWSFRGRTELARTSDHTFNLLLMLDTPWTADHRGRLELAPRDVLIIDSQHPLKTDVGSSFTAVAVTAAEAWLRQWLPNPNLLASRRIPGSSPWGHALSSYVSELSPDLVAAPPLPLSVIADQIGSLLALTMGVLRGTNSPGRPAVRSLREGIHECLMQRCMEPQLSAADVAATLSISVRTLHRTLAAANETFGENLIDARARVAARMLTSALFNRVTTAEIGRRAGFLSASHFARVMRQRTGRTPLQLRHESHVNAIEREDPAQQAADDQFIILPHPRNTGRQA
jgi:AraC-like DNA-binding protein